MARHGVALCGCLLLVSLGSTLLVAQAGGAMLYANGSVKVNGQPTGDSTSVFAGDKVDVGSASAGSINRNGSSVVLSPNSSIQYGPSSIDVLQGSARVSTSKGMSARTGQVVVSPADTVAKFDVLRTDNRIVVVSHEGDLRVQDGTRTIAVQSGARTELPVVGAGSTILADNAGSKSTEIIPENRLSEHPFYGVVSGVASSPGTLPICSNVLSCIRPNVSNIRPCCCPPIIQCH